MSSLKSSIERLASQGEVEHDPEARETAHAMTGVLIRSECKCV